MAFTVCEQCKGQRMHFALGGLVIKCKHCAGLGRTETPDSCEVDAFLATQPHDDEQIIKPKIKGKPGRKKRSQVQTGLQV